MSLLFFFFDFAFFIKYNKDIEREKSYDRINTTRARAK